MFGTNLAAPTMITDTIRWVFAMLDRPFYWLLTIMYQIFFNVSSAQLFDQTVSRFFGRVQLIIGVYMMFQLAVTILKGIVDPDTFTKNEGGSKGVIVRIIIALLMLAVLMPIKVPNPTREFDQQISNQGLLFGTLNSLQYRIVSNNTLGRLILGTKDDDGNYLSGGDDIQQELEDSAKIFSSSVLKTFYRINLIPEKERKHEEGKTDDMINDNRLCTDIDDQTLETYTKLNANPTEIIDLVNRTCTTQYDTSTSIFNLGGLLGSKVYMFDYNPILSLIVAVVFCVILLSFTMDVVVRSAKLAFLRLLAPIPIISYMDPNGSKDGAFNSWWKTLLSTYIDLFVRLSIIYFVIFIIQDMMINGIVINNVEGPIGLVSLVLIYIGLFAFAKQAPKFIREVLGMKGEGGNFFSGLEAIGTAAGMGAAALGTIGSMRANYRASKMADETRQSFGENVDPTSLPNRAKHLIAGIAGGVMGGVTGATALAGAKDHHARAVMDAIGKRNATALSRGNDGSTLLGRMRSTASNVVLGEGQAARIDREVASSEGKISALESVSKQVSAETPKYTWTYGTGDKKGEYQDLDGNSLQNVLFNFKQFQGQIEEARAGGQSFITVKDKNGVDHRISVGVATQMEGTIRTTNEDDYIQTVLSGGFSDPLLTEYIEDAQRKGASTISTRGDYKDQIRDLTVETTQKKRENIINKANDQHSGDKK